MQLKLTLRTADGCTGSGIFDANDDVEIKWDVEPELETTEALFEYGPSDDSPLVFARISGEDWRQMENEGCLSDIPLMLRYGIDLGTAVGHAIEGCWPSNFDGDIARELDTANKAVERLRNTLSELLAAMETPRSQKATRAWTTARATLEGL